MVPHILYLHQDLNIINLIIVGMLLILLKIPPTNFNYKILQLSNLKIN
jgi:hypothetical protein